MNQYISDKIKIISFLLMCMVVMIHAHLLGFQSSERAMFIQQLISGRLTRVAVPFFFLISGYLFAFNIDAVNVIGSIKGKIYKRSKTLLVPYLLWSFICLVVLFVVEQIPQMSGVFSEKLKWTIPGILNEVFVNPQVAYQLWFVRDLIVMVIASPVIYYTARYCKWLLLPCLILLALTKYSVCGISVSAIVFFSMGIFIALHGQKIVTHRCLSPLWMLCSVVWLGMNLYFQIDGIDTIYTSMLNVCVGILAIWTGYDVICKFATPGALILEISSYSFIVYLLHEPSLTVFKRLWISILGLNSEASTLTLYFIAPTVITILCMSIGYLFKNRFPYGYRVFTGGR